MVVSRVFVRSIIVNSIAQNIDGEASANPGEEIIIRDQFLRDVVVPIVFVRDLVVRLRGVIRYGLMVSVAATAECSC